VRVIERTSCFPCGQPYFAGHFPGRPIVPGVALLEVVVEFAREWLGARCRLSELPVVKFMAPLGPGEEFVVMLEEQTDCRLRFRVVRGDTLIASGSIVLSGPDAK
jgi:3-hydroxymyristoyl/3-hydroxydecanoyl-(acyl carrier protein) dehydratase